MKKLEKTLQELSPVSELLERGNYIDSIMKKACKPFTIRELDRQPVHFFCRCSPDRFKNALALLNHKDLEELEGEDQEMVCHYCGNRHVVTEEEINQIAESARAKLN
jgi:molecular chaperone Hsp33